ncbi:MAG: hypothetical protein JWM43_1994 [Acidobacteriaceae bacterium]|nr:hypothetical protein [Acidobacteriaceae bacterium]
MRWIARLAALGCVVFVMLQFVRPALTNPPVAAEIQAPPEVKAVLKRSCYSCHSNETALPWFDQVVPAYWVATHDVKMARQHLNFSEIGKLPAAAQRAMLFEAVTQIQLGAMPLPRYLKAHPEAALTPADLAVLKSYLVPFGKTAVSDAVTIAAADTQYKDWNGEKTPMPAIHAAPNGIEFFRDYKDWKAISTTDRGDNRTMRVIAGNDIAIRAIESKQIHPWPDGAAFAKIAWTQMTDNKGVIRPGQFKQVEFMVKDKTKYASTAGWGWARWLGMDLKPYGKSAAFTGECVSCHQPVKDNDFVYTMPITRTGGTR